MIGTPFDKEAITYDSTFEDNPVTQHIRPLIWKSLLKCFPHGSHVLELNCGTGTDAVMLAEHGIHVTAIDNSPKMIEQARQKVQQLRFEHMIDLHHLSFESLNRLDGVSFDGAFSNFGGLNCSESLPRVLNDVDRLLKPDAYFIACVMNKYCIWETASFLLRGKLTSAFRRIIKEGTDAIVGTELVHVWYYSLRQFANMLNPLFHVDRAYGLNIFSPSPNARSFITSKPTFTQRLLHFDDTIQNLRPWNSLGDHFVIEAQRRPR